MPLSKGDRLGPYEILALVGKGGMGEVYRAHDSRLGRDVAIKVSTSPFTERFTREARVVASLNHANVCHLYDVGPDYLVMEYVEGVAPHGKYPLDRALSIASQIAAALEAAHAKGIVHRDLKPGNIIIKADGTVKVLDFGLSKIMQEDAIGPEDRTRSMPLTAIGTVMGTAGYMAPEQAEGKSVDKRADIWGFGVILFELLTGQRLFGGATVQETLAQVLSLDPDLTRVPANTHLLLRRCLARDPSQRLRDIGDAMPLIGYEFQNDGLKKRPPSRRYWPWAAALCALAIVAFGIRQFWQAPAAKGEPFRFRISYPEGVKPNQSATFSFSPDGKTIAYSTGGSEGFSLWVQALDSLEPRLLLGPTMKIGDAPAFWSADSKSLIFDSEGWLKKADLSGGGAQTLCETPGRLVIGGSSNGDQILFGTLSPAGIMKVPAGGGTPVSVTQLDAARKERGHVFPFFLPDRKHFLYLRQSSEQEYAGIYVGSLDTAPKDQSKRRLIAGSTEAEFVAGSGGTGKLLFLRDGALVAQDFDTNSLQLQGEPKMLAEGVGNTRAFAYFASSASGNLIYRSTPVRTSQMAWFDRRGQPISRVGDPLPPSGDPRLSPSGAQFAVPQWDYVNRTNDLWLYTLSPYASFRLLPASTALNDAPVWSADGKRIAYSSSRSGRSDLYQTNANGDGQQMPLLESPGHKIPTSWSRDGYLLYGTRGRDTARDIWVLPPTGNPFAFLDGSANEYLGSFSPDGRWVAYLSDEAGAVQLYVRSFSPAPESGSATIGPRIPVSTNGAAFPHWRGDGRELFFVDPDGNLMVIPFAPGSQPVSGQAAALFPAPTPDHWDVSGDGQRFLFGVPVGQQSITPFTVVLNWQAGLPK